MGVTVLLSYLGHPLMSNLPGLFRPIFFSPRPSCPSCPFLRCALPVGFASQMKCRYEVRGNRQE